MRKEEYKIFINPTEFAELYEEWAANGKPKGNHPLYIKIWDGVTNAVKACIGALQNRYHCKYQNYDEKVLDGTILIINKLINMNSTPKNIISICYLPVLGICCGTKAIQSEFEENTLSTDTETNGSDTFTDMMYLDEYGIVQYGYDNL